LERPAFSTKKKYYFLPKRVFSFYGGKKKNNKKGGKTGCYLKQGLSPAEHVLRENLFKKKKQKNPAISLSEKEHEGILEKKKSREKEGSDNDCSRPEERGSNYLQKTPAYLPGEEGGRLSFLALQKKKRETLEQACVNANNLPMWGGGEFGGKGWTLSSGGEKWLLIYELTAGRKKGTSGAKKKSVSSFFGGKGI